MDKQKRTIETQGAEMLDLNRELIVKGGTEINDGEVKARATLSTTRRSEIHSNKKIFA